MALITSKKSTIYLLGQMSDTYGSDSHERASSAGIEQRDLTAK